MIHQVAALISESAFYWITLVLLLSQIWCLFSFCG